MSRYHHRSWIIGLLALALGACPSSKTTTESDAGSQTPTSPSEMGSGGKSAAGDDAGSGGRGHAGSGGGTPDGKAGNGGTGVAGSAAHSGEDPDQDAGVFDATCPPNLPVPANCKVCDDGSCGTPLCKDGALTGAYQCPGQHQPPPKPMARDCVVGGCSSQLCTDSATGPVVSTCEWREEYACYRAATCEQQPNGKCGWTPTPELDKCLQGAGARP